MALHLALAVSALAASLALVATRVVRPLAIVALLASGLEVAMAVGLVRLRPGGAPLGVVLGLALALPGLVAWLRASSKAAVSSASIVALAGALQIFVSLRL